MAWSQSDSNDDKPGGSRERRTAVDARSRGPRDDAELQQWDHFWKKVDDFDQRRPITEAGDRDRDDTTRHSSVLGAAGMAPVALGLPLIDARAGLWMARMGQPQGLNSFQLTSLFVLATSAATLAALMAWRAPRVSPLLNGALLRGDNRHDGHSGALDS